MAFVRQLLREDTSLLLLLMLAVKTLLVPSMYKMSVWPLGFWTS